MPLGRPVVSITTEAVDDEAGFDGVKDHCRSVGEFGFKSHAIELYLCSLLLSRNESSMLHRVA